MSVANKDGGLIANIPQSAFKIYENGVEQPTKSFRTEETPVSIGLVIDNSASMRPKRANVITASMILVNALSPKDEMFVVMFSHRDPLSSGAGHCRANLQHHLHVPSRLLAKDLARDFRMTCKLLLALTTLLALSGQESPKIVPGTLTLQEVVHLVKSGVSEELIVARVKRNAKPFDLSSDEILELKRSGVSETVIKFLLDPTAPLRPRPLLPTRRRSRQYRLLLRLRPLLTRWP